MANNRIVLEGLDAFQAALKALPQEFHDEGMAVVKATTEAAAAEMRAAYPERDYGAPGKRGNLRKGVKVDFPSMSILVGIARSTSPHAHLYEFGTQERTTAHGAHRGSVRPHPVTVPIARKRRNQMVDSLVALVKAKGFEVSGQ